MKKKQLLAMLLALALCLGLAGCGGGAASSAAPAEPAEPEGLQVVELPIETDAVHYSCWMPVAPYVSTMMNLEDFSEQVAMVKMINEMTNVYIDFNAVAGGFVEQESFNLMIAAATTPISSAL